MRLVRWRQTVAIFLLMAAVSRVARARPDARPSGSGVAEIVDIVTDANPGMPWCWGALTLQRSASSTDALIARRATISLLPGAFPAVSCASARLSARWSLHVPATSALVWHRQWDIDLGHLRELAATSCRVRAWLQFGRIPQVAGGRIVDLRFENPIGQNFTPMAIDTGSASCPGYLAPWEWPRRDVLGPRVGDNGALTH